MIKYNSKDIVKAGRLLFAGIAAMSLWSCQSDILDDGADIEVPADGIVFKATINNGPRLQTRKGELTQEPELVTHSRFPDNFYIEIDAQDIDGQPKNEIGTYVVPSGFQGQLGVKGDATPLNWFNANSMHNFWSWTVPWLSDGTEPDPDDTTDPDDKTEPTDPTNPTPGTGDGMKTRADESEIYTPSTEPLTLTLADTHYDEYNTEGSWNNGEILETFVGAQSGPYSYKQNGRDVPLQHQHLMSKIVIESITFNAADGSTHYDITGEISFINMPNKFTFYPHPTEDGTPKTDNALMKKDGPPIVVTDQSTASPNSGLTFAINNPPDTTQFDEFYICPEIDFSEVEFKVKVNNPEGESWGSRGEYWGNFKNVTFERVDNVDYDVADGTDDTVLHAGEVMYFNLILQQYGGGGTSIYIRNWNSGPINTTKHYPHNGLYTEADLRALVGNNNKSAEQWDEQFELLGDGTTKDEPETLYPDEYPGEKNPYADKEFGIFKLYGNATMGSYTMYVGKGYVLDGMGYTVNMTPPASNPNYDRLVLGNMRDIYINMGDFSIYVDPNGWIYFYDYDSGEYIISDMQLDGSYTTYTIDLTNKKFASRSGAIT